MGALKQSRLMRLTLFILVLLILNVVSAVADSTDPNPTDETQACALTGDRADGLGLDVAEFGLDVAEFGLDVTEFGLDVAEFGLDVAEFGLDVTEFGLDVTEFTNAIVQLVDPANYVDGSWLTSQIDTINGGVGYNSVPVKIFIVDDFAGEPLGDLQLLSQGDSHGARVLSVFLFLRDQLIESGEPTPNLHFEAIDISTVDFEITAIASLIETAAQTSPDFLHKVFNLSFGFIPCEDEMTIIIPVEGGDPIEIDLVWDFDKYIEEVEESETNPPGATEKISVVLECVDQISTDEGTFWRSYWGYDSKHDVEVTIPVGGDNKFTGSPLGQDSGQPAVFKPGRQRFVFSVDFTGQNLVWTLESDKRRTGTAGRLDNCGSVPDYSTDPSFTSVGTGLTDYFVNQLGEGNEDLLDEFLDALVGEGGYLEELAGEYNDNDDAAIEAFETVMANLTTMSATGTMKTVVVAASGNHAHLFGPAPFYPASSENVVAVSGGIGDLSTTRSFFSNTGNTLAPGYSFVLARNSEGEVTSLFPGSSGAAPHSATHVALWLTYPHACSFVDVSGNPAPPLVDGARAKDAQFVFDATQDPFNCERNFAPWISVNFAGISLDEGSTNIPAGTFGDTDGTVVSITADQPAVTINKNDTNGTWSINVGDGPVGPVTVTVTATDDDGATATTSFTLTILEVAEPEVPQCDGQDATIHLIPVGDGIYQVVGGPRDGHTYQPGVDTLRGSQGPDVIVGTEDDDRIRTGWGTDIVCGLGGDDNIYSREGRGVEGRTGNDRIFGGDGNDDIYPTDGDDYVEGGDGNDRVFAKDGNDIIFGGPGDDRLHGQNGDDTIDAGPGDDRAWGGHGEDTIAGGPGDDMLYGQNDNDTLRGGENNRDPQPNEDGDDTIYGGNGDDAIGGKGGNDRLFGQGGNDIIFGDAGDDTIKGGGGNDTCNGDDNSGGTGTDTARQCETVINVP